MQKPRLALKAGYDKSRVVEQGEGAVAERGNTKEDTGQALLDEVSAVMQEGVGEARASDGGGGQLDERSVDSVDKTDGQDGSPGVRVGSVSE